MRQWTGNICDLDFRGVIDRCSSFLLVCSSLDELKKPDAVVLATKSPKDLPASTRGKIAFFRVWCLVGKLFM